MTLTQEKKVKQNIKEIEEKYLDIMKMDIFCDGVGYGILEGVTELKEKLRRIMAEDRGE